MDTDYRKAANITVIVLGAAVFIWFFIKYALGAAIPFILASLIAAFLSPVAELLSKKLKISRKIISAALTLIFFAAIVTILYFAISRLIGELGNLIYRLSENPDIINKAISDLSNSLGAKFGFLRRILQSEELQNLGIDVDKLLTDALGSVMSSLTSSLPTAAMGIVSSIPETILFVAVLLISSFYLCIDHAVIMGSLCSLLPERWQQKLPIIKNTVTSTLTGYLKAYLLIMLLTFTEVFIGLTILGVDYALIISVVVAIVDVLPILGTGTVLIPWAIFCFITHNTSLGVGLLILYAVVLVVRQLAEPKIVGNTLGLHPLATLASIYLGIKFLGFGGIFIGPIAAMLIKSFFFKENDKCIPESEDKKIPEGSE